MWWFAATHANLLLMYRQLSGPAAAGFPDRTVLGLDADADACARAAAKSARPVCAGSINALPFADGVFGAIFSADVLCHRDVDEHAALAQFHRCLSDGGLLVLNLPAYKWMLSRHDAAVSNVRRYTRRGVARLLQAAGFRLVFASYWNIVLFPVMVLTRKLLPQGEGAVSDVRLYPAPVEALCRAATAVERAILRCGMRFPFGGSVIAVAAKDVPGGGDV
jgi:SAM-dependent methyltransferase